jgi:hypothetical protein
MDMRKILQAMDGASTKAEVNSSDMRQFLTIVEGKGPLNRLTAAESMAMQHHVEKKKTITNPVLNVQEDARPSMIGKYFKAVEQELSEAADQNKERTYKLAERIANKINEGGITLPNPDGSLPPGAFTAADQEKLNQRVGAQAAATAQPPKGVNLAPDYLQKAASGAPGRWMISADDAKLALDWLAKNPNYKPPSAEPAPAAPAGYNIDYLKKAADPNRTGRYMISIEKAQELLQQQDGSINEAEGEPEGVAHLTKELLTHIVQQSGKEGAHAVVKSLTWGDGAAKELLHLIINDLKDDIADMNEGLRDPKDNPCWKGYKPVGTKKKAGRTVPNCVPTSEAANAAQQAAIAIAKKKAGKK